jgi:septal ring factor EnvC (AmiA/AmiB activator)
MSEDTKEQAFQDLRFLTDRFKGVLSLMDDMKDLSSLDGAVREAGNELKKAYRKLADAEAQYLELDERVINKAAVVENMIAEETAKQRFKNIEDNEALRTAARVEAGKITDAAHAERDKLFMDHRNVVHEVVAKRDELKDLESRIAARGLEHDQLVEAVAAERSALASVKRELDTIRTTLGMTHGNFTRGEAE